MGKKKSRKKKQKGLSEAKLHLLAAIITLLTAILNLLDTD